MQQRRKNAGFTLLELTCAIFIIAMAGFGAIQLYSIGLDKIIEMRAYDVATEVLRNDLEQLRARPFAALKDGMTPAPPSPALESLHKPKRTVSVAPGELPALKQVTVTLRWQHRQGRWIERSLTTLIADKNAGATP